MVVKRKVVTAGGSYRNSERILVKNIIRSHIRINYLYSYLQSYKYIRAKKTFNMKNFRRVLKFLVDGMRMRMRIKRALFICYGIK